MAGELEGHVALVTGAASGIGRRTSQMLAAEGAYLCLFDMNESGLTELKNELTAKGAKAVISVGDSSDERAAESAVNTAMKAFGKLHLLLNGASIVVRKNLLDTTPEEWRRVIDVDLNGYYYVLRAAVPRIRDSGGGSIVQIASIAASIGFGYPSYTAAKGAVLSLTRQLGSELAPYRIRINSVSPGPTDTGINRDTMGDPAIKQAIVANTPVGRTGQPEDIARAILFLLSPKSGYITGADLVIDGGMMSTIHWGKAGSSFHSYHSKGAAKQ